MTDIKTIASQCLMQKSRKASRNITALYEAAFSKLDLTGGQFSILVAVSLNQGAPLTPIAIGLGMDRTTLTRALKPLERRELVEMNVGPTDSRARIIEVTAKGKALLDEAIPLWEGAQAQVVKQFSKSELLSLQSGLSGLGKA